MTERFLRSLGVRLVLPALAGAVLCFLVSPVALAQTGAEGGLTNPLPHTSVAPAPPSLPSSGSPSGPPGMIETPPPAAGEEEAAPAEEARPPVRPKPAARRRRKVITHFEVEPAQAKLLLKKDALVYSKPDKESKISARVQAGKYVVATGSTRYYVRVRLKSGKVGFVPISAVDLVKPTDKLFRLTSNAPVRKDPNRWARKLSEVHKGRSVHVVGIALSYAKIRMRSGLEGYIPLKALE
jgi:uncharacterized protein YgiM (DUF1202 family)